MSSQCDEFLLTISESLSNSEFPFSKRKKSLTVYVGKVTESALLSDC